jgi:hypothetical protein
VSESLELLDVFFIVVFVGLESRRGPLGRDMNCACVFCRYRIGIAKRAARQLLLYVGVLKVKGVER